MVNRLWIAAIVIAGLCYWGISYVMNAPSGDAEFQKMLEATKQVKTFRGAYTSGPSDPQHSTRLWEVDCNLGIIHQQSDDSQTVSYPPTHVKLDQFLVGVDRFVQTGEKSWQKNGDTHVYGSGKWYCDNLAQATVRDLLPDTRAMLRSAMIGAAEKKTVNGVACQNWRFAMKSATSGQKGWVCIGIEDHLPYEMTIENGGRYSYSDYNRPIQMDAPESVMDAATAAAASN